VGARKTIAGAKFAPKSVSVITFLLNCFENLGKDEDVLEGPWVKVVDFPRQKSLPLG